MHNVQWSQHKGHKSQVTAHKSIYYRYTSQSDRNKSRHLTQNQLLCKVLQTSCIERDKPTKRFPYQNAVDSQEHTNHSPTYAVYTLMGNCF